MKSTTETESNPNISKWIIVVLILIITLGGFYFIPTIAELRSRQATLHSVVCESPFGIESYHDYDSAFFGKIEVTGISFELSNGIIYDVGLYENLTFYLDSLYLNITKFAVNFDVVYDSKLYHIDHQFVDTLILTDVGSYVTIWIDELDSSYMEFVSNDILKAYGLKTIHFKVRGIMHEPWVDDLDESRLFRIDQTITYEPFKNFNEFEFEAL